MVSKRRKIQRPLGKRRYKKLFVIATEGTKTEPEYFGIFKRQDFKDQDFIIHVKCLKSEHGYSPTEVLRQMEQYLRKKELKQSDEAWLVVDKDSYTLGLKRRTITDLL